MKITGNIGNRIIDFEGKKIALHEKSYDAGYSAAMAGEPVQEFSSSLGCQMSWAVGYTDGFESIALKIEALQRGACGSI